MSWIRLLDIDLTQGSSEITVRDAVDLSAVVEGWVFVHGGALYELVDGTVMIGGAPQLFLKEPWALASEAATSAAIIPVNAPLETLLRRLLQSIEDVQAIKAYFEPLSFDGGRWPLLVNAELDGIEAVPVAEFILATGIDTAVLALAGAEAATQAEAQQSVGLVSGEAVAKFSAVAIGAFGNAFGGNPEVPPLTRVFGISLTETAGPAAIQVKVSGPVRNPLWAWTPGEPLYLQPNGGLSHDLPAAGDAVIVALPIKPDTIVLNTPRIS